MWLTALILGIYFKTKRMLVQNLTTNKTDQYLNNSGKATGYIIRIALTAALAGFIFGFDTVVISGANLPIKELWHTSPLFHGFFIMSMALWGTVIGAVFGGIPTEKFGRKNGPTTRPKQRFLVT